MIGHGVSSRSSHSWAAGRTTPSAKPCTQSRMSSWSCVRSSVKAFPSAVAGGSPAIPAGISSDSESGAVVVTSLTAEDVTQIRVVELGFVTESSDRVAKVEGAQALGTVVVAVEEAVVDAAVRLALAVIGLLDLEGAMRQRRAGHLDPAEAALLLYRREVHLGAEHF